MRSSSLRAASRVIARTGDLPPVARYRSVISWTSSGGVRRPPRTSLRYGPTASRESGPPIAINSTPIGASDITVSLIVIRYTLNGGLDEDHLPYQRLTINV